MEANTLVQIISTVGFPIFACCALGYLLYREQNEHKEEIQKLTEALNGNTTIMAQLKQLLEDLRHGLSS